MDFDRIIARRLQATSSSACLLSQKRAFRQFHCATRPGALWASQLESASGLYQVKTLSDDSVFTWRARPDLNRRSPP